MMRISLVVPVFNEEATINEFYRAVREFTPLHDYDVEIIFVNDGSRDSTAAIVATLAKNDRLVSKINFTRNFGKEAALFAGLEHASGDVVIPIDVDLQDPIEVIPLLLQRWEKGADIVLAKRRTRNRDGLFKRTMAEWFYFCLLYTSPSPRD